MWQFVRVIYACVVLYIYVVNCQDDAGDTGSGCFQVDHCNDCHNPPLECLECGPGKMILEDKSGCIDCPDSCAKCHQDQDLNLIVCDECFKGIQGYNYVLGRDGLCKVCPSNCLTCYLDDTKTTVCETCIDLYVLNPTNRYCLPCPQGCLKCRYENNAAVCEESIPRTYINPYDISYPVKSCIDGCAECVDGSTCDLCDPGYYVTAQETCQSCPFQCEICSIVNNEEKCAQCLPGYGGSDEPTCDPCPDSCLQCDSTGSCNLCASGYVADTGDIPSCHPCPRHCKVCSWSAANRKTVCTIDGCDELFAYNPDEGTCHACDENCESTCVWRKQNEYLDNNNLLAPYANDPLYNIHGPVCLNCKVGYGTTLYGNCRACPDGCIACYEYEDNSLYSSTHMACFLDAEYYCFSDFDYDNVNDGEDAEYHILNTKIRVGPDSRKRRAASYARRKIRSKLSSNPVWRTVFPKSDKEKRATFDTDGDGAETADNYIRSRSCCKPGFGPSTASYTYFTNTYLVDTCNPCNEPNCVSCSGGLNVCDKCDDNYGLINNACEACNVDLCKNCNNIKTQCAECINYLDYGDHRVNVIRHNNLCYDCPQYCLGVFDGGALKCSYNNGQGRTECDNNCMPHTGIHQGDLQCYLCSDTHCSVCTFSSADTETCQSCDDRYVRDPTDSISCRACPASCAVCSYVSNVAKCTLCDEGYTVNDDGRCSICNSKCDGCYSSDGEILCTECATRHTKDGFGDCVECPENCASCSYNVDDGRVSCDTCNTKYGMVADNSCRACPALCTECTIESSNDNTLKCRDCESGYRINDKTCGACPSGCATCSEREGILHCSTCLEGYVYSDIQTICLACLAECTTCELKNDAAFCSLCSNGYVATIGGSCATCPDTTGVSRCTLCSPLDDSGVSVCLDCEEGFTLRDNALECLSCSEGDLSNCGGEMDVCADKGYVCTYCEPGYEVYDDKCGYNCLQCSGEGSDCNTEDELRDTSSNVTIVPCVSGACWAYHTETSNGVKVERGCYTDITCSSDHQNSEQCEDNGVNATDKVCGRCCTDESCNTFVMTGKAGITQSFVIEIVFAFGLICLIL